MCRFRRGRLQSSGSREPAESLDRRVILRCLVIAAVVVNNSIKAVARRLRQVITHVTGEISFQVS